MMCRNFYSGAAAAIIVYAVNSNESFKKVEQFHNDVKQLCSDDTVIVIAGNKCDLLQAKMVTFDDLEYKAAELDCDLYFETSATNEKCETIEAMFNEIIRELSKKARKSNANIRLDR